VHLRRKTKQRSSSAPLLKYAACRLFKGWRLLVFSTTAVCCSAAVCPAALMRCCGMRCCCMRSAVRRPDMPCCRSRASLMCSAAANVGRGAAGANCRCVACVSAAGVSTIGRLSASAVIAPAATTAEAMTAPAMVIAPACPWTHAQENAVVEVTRPVKSNGRAGVRCIVVVTVGTHRLNPDANDYLRIRRWRIRFQDPERKQCGREQCF